MQAKPRSSPLSSTEAVADAGERSGAGEIHIQKLAFGIKSIEALRRRVKQRTAGKGGAHVILTRTMPKRADELLSGGCVYWVIAGQIRARQRIVSISSFGKGRVKRCRMVLDPLVVETECIGRKPFQGWRYLTASDAPGDLTKLEAAAGLPPSIHRELADLGLL